MRIIVAVLLLNLVNFYSVAQQADTNRKDALGKARPSMVSNAPSNKPASNKKNDTDTVNRRLVSNAEIFNSNVPLSNSKIR